MTSQNVFIQTGPWQANDRPFSYRSLSRGRVSSEAGQSGRRVPPTRSGRNRKENKPRYSHDRRRRSRRVPRGRNDAAPGLDHGRGAHDGPPPREPLSAGLLATGTRACVRAYGRPSGGAPASARESRPVQPSRDTVTFRPVCRTAAGPTTRRASDGPFTLQSSHTRRAFRRP